MLADGLDLNLGQLSGAITRRDGKGCQHYELLLKVKLQLPGHAICNKLNVVQSAEIDCPDGRVTSYILYANVVPCADVGPRVIFRNFNRLFTLGLSQGPHGRIFKGVGIHAHFDDDFTLTQVNVEREGIVGIQDELDL